MAYVTRVAPELPVADLRQAVAFYAQKLGFELASEMPDGDYAIVERDGAAIHLFTEAGQRGAPVRIHLFTADLEELEAEFLARGVQLAQRIEPKPWGTRDFRLHDPAGNELKFTESRRE